MISPKTGHRAAAMWCWCLFVTCLAGVLFDPAEVRAGSALRLYYSNIRGDTVAELMADPSFPGSPSSTEALIHLLSRLERGGDNWGSWVRAYLEPPQTGDYTFLLSSDNGSELWLSTSHEAFQVRKILENTNVTARLDFRAQSEPISLVKGQKYYFELYHKEGIGLDHVSVAWRLPDGTLESPVPSSRFMPVPVDDKYQTVDQAPVFAKEYRGRTTAALTNTVASEGNTITLLTAPEGSQPMVFQWFKDGKPIPGANLSSLTLTNVQANDSGQIYRVIASNHLGVATAEGSLTVVPDNRPLEMFSAVSFASNAVAVFFSKPLDPGSASLPGNYELNHGAAVKSAQLISETSVRLAVAPLQDGKSYQLRVKNVKDGGRRNVLKGPAAVKVDDGLQAWLRFDRTEDDLVPDSSGNFNAAALMNGAKLARDGMSGACLELDGVNDYAVLPSGFENFTNGITVALWVKPLTNGFWARFLDFGNGPAQDNILFAREAGTSNLAFECYRTQLMKVIAPDVLEVGRWQHIGATMNAKGEVSIYKNGQITKQGQTNIPRVLPRTSNLIGRSNWDMDAYYKGSMDELRIYERALTASEIKALAGLVQ